MEHFQTVHRKRDPIAEPSDAALAQNPDTRPQTVTPSCAFVVREPSDAALAQNSDTRPQPVTLSCAVVVREQKSRKNPPTKGTSLVWCPTIYEQGKSDANDQDVDDICRSIEVTGIEDSPNLKPTTSKGIDVCGGDEVSKIRDPGLEDLEPKGPETTTLKVDKMAPNSPPPGPKNQNQTRRQKSDKEKLENDKKPKKVKTEKNKPTPIPLSPAIPKWGIKPPTKTQIKANPEPKNPLAATTREVQVGAQETRLAPAMKQPSQNPQAPAMERAPEHSPEKPQKSVIQPELTNASEEQIREKVPEQVKKTGASTPATKTPPALKGGSTTTTEKQSAKPPSTITKTKEALAEDPKSQKQTSTGKNPRRKKWRLQKRHQENRKHKGPK